MNEKYYYASQERTTHKTKKLNIQLVMDGYIPFERENLTFRTGY
jgi:hypothetical protein